MLQNTCKTLGFKKNRVYKIPLGGGKPYPSSGLLLNFTNFNNFVVVSQLNILSIFPLRKGR